MESGLSHPQQRILTWIEDYIAEHGISPTYREVQRGVGYRSVAPVQTHIHALAQKGFITHLPRKARSLKMLRPSESIPVLGVVAANSLVETFTETTTEYLELSCLPKLARLSKHERSQHFALRVRGDSMVGALIDDGDVVILRKESNPQAIRNQTIVAARVNRTTTLKYFSRQGKLVTLLPANPNYQATTIDTAVEELEIQGIYVGVLRGLV